MTDDQFPEDDDTEVEEDERTQNRPRGWLANDVKTICDLWITGELKIKEDKPLTPHRAAMAVKEVDGLDKPPSTGAVAAVFNRWKDLGFAEFSETPFAFIGYSEQGKMLGLKRMQEMARAARADARASRRGMAGQTTP